MLVGAMASVQLKTFKINNSHIYLEINSCWCWRAAVDLGASLSTPSLKWIIALYSKTTIQYSLALKENNVPSKKKTMSSVKEFLDLQIASSNSRGYQSSSDSITFI